MSSAFAYRRNFEKQAPMKVAPPSSHPAGYKHGYRTLSTYPMDHGYRDTLQIVATCRSDWEKGQNATRRAAVVSNNRTKHSKALFDEAIGNISRMGSDAGSGSSLPRLGSAETNTPSYAQHYGVSRAATSSDIYGNQNEMQSLGIKSPVSGNQDNWVYTGRTKLLNDLSMRPMSGSTTPYLPFSATTDIREIMQKSNSTFRVVPTSSVTSSAPNKRDNTHNKRHQKYLLVPADMDTMNRNIYDISTSEQDDETISIGIQIVPGEGTDPEGTDPDTGTAAQPDSAVPEEDMNKNGSTEMMEEDGDQSEQPGLSPGNPRGDPNNMKSVLRVDDAQKSGSSFSSTKSKTRPRRVTWVDDATVLSIDVASKHDAEDMTQEDGACANDNIVDAQSVENVESPPVVASVVNLKDLHDNSWSLPDFICPTSEEKSKQARMRDWIKTNNFAWASRSLPLL